MRVKPNSLLAVLVGLTLNFGLSTTASAAPAIVGSWHIDLPNIQGVTTFLADGTYFDAIDVTGDSVHTGIEWGNYSWNDITGEVTATSLGDFNGNWGIAGDVDGSQFFSISGDTASVFQPGCSGCGHSDERVLHPANSIVGTWLVPGGFAGTITFLANGSYIHGEEAHDGGLSGVERGTYSWDSVTGVLVTTSIVTDTNGVSGLSHPHGTTFVSLNASGCLTFTDDLGSGDLVAAPVPEAQTYAMMLAGLGLVGGMAARRRKQIS